MIKIKIKINYDNYATIKEYLVDTGIARDAQQAEMALIAKDWNLNSAADAVLTGAL